MHNPAAPRGAAEPLALSPRIGGRRAALRRAATGFTLVELLIVILIISVLASLLMAGVSRARKKLSVTQIKNDINGLVNALEAYRLDEGVYPGAGIKEVDENTNLFPVLYEALCGDPKPAGRGGRNAPYIELKSDNTLVEDPDDARGFRPATTEEIRDPQVEKFYADAFGNPYIYRENDSKRKKEPWMWKPHKYDLWSKGPDQIDQSYPGPSEEETDDIGNW